MTQSQNQNYPGNQNPNAPQDPLDPQRDDRPDDWVDPSDPGVERPVKPDEHNPRIIPE
jgi:hypothetical protein